jgi:hypothetical protein
MLRSAADAFRDHLRPDLGCEDVPGLWIPLIRQALRTWRLGLGVGNKICIYLFVFNNLDGGEGGIRTHYRRLESVTCRFYLARNATNAIAARAACPTLPDGGHRRGNGGMPRGGLISRFDRYRLPQSGRAVYGLLGSIERHS